MIVHNWKEALDKLDTLDTESAPDIDNLCATLNLHDCFGCYPDDERLRKLWIHSWMCTDTAVGLAVYTLDGKPVAVSEQPARKSDECVWFISVETAAAVEAYIRSLCPVRLPPPIADLEELIDPSWFEKIDG